MPAQRRTAARPDDPKTRVRELVSRLRAGPSTSGEVSEAFWELDRLPPDIVKAELAAWLGPLPDMDRLDDRIRAAVGLPLRPLRLRTLSVVSDADVLDLGPIVDEQVRIAGRSWDGEDRTAEERLDGELEGSFAGTLEHRVLGDADAPGDTPLFDVLRFEGDSGVVFAAGSTRVVSYIAYDRVEMRDRRIRTAIMEALAAEKPPVENVVAPKKPAPPRKMAVKKVSAKKPPAKKTAPPKKMAVKKVSAKKSVSKKTATKKTAAKKSAIKTR